MIDKLFRQRTDNAYLQFFRYFFVSGTGFVVDIGLLFVFSDIFGIYYLISAALSFIIATFVNYLMSTKWVFNQDNIENKFLDFNLFMLIGIIGLVFTEILLYLFTDIVGLYYIISKVITACIVLFWNFLARKHLYSGKN